MIYTSNSPPNDAVFVQQALQLAAQALGRTDPNPPVGCLVVNNGQVIGRGFHALAGQSHAEPLALQQAGEAARGATLYVTLEPCNHHGRTPPCTEAILAAGIRRVVVSALDPDPRVAGRGVARLKQAGIEVDVGLGEAEALQQQAGFRSRVVWGRPWVIYKYAMTLDGAVATHQGHSQWVSSPQSRALVQQLRLESGAVAVGSGTVLADDPQLTARLPQQSWPLRPILFDRRGRIPPQARAVRPGTILFSNSDHILPWQERGAEVERFTSLEQALQLLGQRGINQVLLEGGPQLATAFWQANLIDEVMVFVAPKLLGGGQAPLVDGSYTRMDQARELLDFRWQAAGPDQLIRGRLKAIPGVR
jgi:diaminohydroxyphosphoribosylaminopyrimidine deaminase/5-amino-6-(5-phosphoribosylamino)uracil reductase